MSENVSVETALKRGHRMTAVPCAILFLACIIGSIYITVTKLVSGWVLPFVYLSTIIIPYLIWSIRIVYWRLWAFENVRNVHELKKRAIQESLIYKENSFFDKTEIWTKSQRTQWESLKEKFKQDDIFNDDLNVPSETIICYAKNKAVIEIVLVIFSFLIGIAFSIVIDSYLLLGLVGIFYAIFTIHIVYTRYQFATNRQPQIIINEKGIETISIPFQKWSVIENEGAILKGSTDSKRKYLYFEYPEGHAEIRIDYLEIDISTLNMLLRIYRGRNEKNKSGY